MEFYLAQLFALLAWGILIVSFWKYKNDELLYLQIISCVFFMINYALLGAWTGVFVVALELVRDILYVFFKDDKKIFLISLPVYLLIGVLSYNSKWSLFSVLASLVDGYALTYHGKMVVFLGILSYILWLIYDLFCSSYAGALAALVLIFSNIIILILRKEKKKI